MDAATRTTCRLTRAYRANLPFDRHAPGVAANRWAGVPLTYRGAAHLTLCATVSGEPDARSGYLCDIRALDGCLARVCNAGIAPRPAEPAPAMLRRAWRALADDATPELHGVTLDALELSFSPHLVWHTSREIDPMIRMTESFEFSAAHRLHCPELSEAENRRLFGKCGNPAGHGHNYVLDVTIEGEPDTQSGLLLVEGVFERIVHECVIERFDHRHLNVDCPEFARLNPTVENIARVIHDLLAPHFPAPPSTHPRLARVRVWETPKTCAECEAAG
ncbi:MAG: hypothetical protein CHACPFDD_00946 [Phycisphaerae bacterium]|nr:hypothetical protein [Phycisphaerae bacterium]